MIINKNREMKSIVIDNGSGTVKAGFGGDDLPRSSFKPTVGRPNINPVQVGSHLKDCYVGDEARISRSIFSTKPERAIERGQITDWNDIEKVWHHTFYNELRINPSDFSVLLLEPIHVEAQTRSKILEKMFEIFNTPAIYLCPASKLSLFGSGRISGIVRKLWLFSKLKLS